MATSEQSDQFEVQGYFWLPSDPDNRIAGILKFDRTAGGSLSLIGSFSDPKQMFDDETRTTSRILGSTEKKDYTLDDCITIRGSLQLFGGVGRQDLRVGRIIEAAVYEEDEPVTADSLYVDYTYLLNWTQFPGPSVSITERGNHGFEKLTIEAAPIADQSCPIPGGTLTLKHSTGYSVNLEGVTATHNVRAKFTFDEVLPLDDALDSASDLQDLLTFANDRVVAFEKLEYSHPDFAHQTSAGKEYRNTATVYANWNAKARPNPRRTHADHDMCFTYDHLGGMSGIEKMMQAIAIYRTHSGRVANTRYNTSMFLQDILLGRIATLESMHVQKHPSMKITETTKKGTQKRDPNLMERLQGLVDIAGEPFLKLFGDEPERSGRVDRWREKAKSERHNVAHHLGRNLHQDSSELYFISEAAYWLFVIILMRESSAPEAALDHLAMSPRFCFTAKSLCKFI